MVRDDYQSRELEVATSPLHPFGGHVGREAGRQSQSSCRETSWWPGLQEDIAKYVQDCEMCSRKKPLDRKKAGLLSPLAIPGRPWESIGMDFITHLPLTKVGYTAVDVVVDRLTKLMHIAPTIDTTTEADTARLFLNIISKNYGLPSSMIIIL